MAIADEFIRPAAAEVYKRKYGSKQVIISKCDDWHPNTRASARNDRAVKRENEICGLKLPSIYVASVHQSII